LVGCLVVRELFPDVSCNRRTEESFDWGGKDVVSGSAVWVEWRTQTHAAARELRRLCMAVKKLVMKPVKKKKLQVKPIARVKTETVTQFRTGPVID
jgi:hypothetical protein